MFRNGKRCWIGLLALGWLGGLARAEGRVSLHLPAASAEEAARALAKALGVGLLHLPLPQEKHPFTLQGASEHLALLRLAVVYRCAVVTNGHLLIVAPRPQGRWSEPVLDTLASWGHASEEEVYRDFTDLREALLRPDSPEEGTPIEARMAKLLRKMALAWLQAFFLNEERRDSFRLLKRDPGGGYEIEPIKERLPPAPGEEELRKWGLMDEGGNLRYLEWCRRMAMPPFAAWEEGAVLVTPLSLSWEGKEWFEALPEISRQARVSVSASSPLKVPPLTAEMERVPLWAVLDGLSLLSGYWWAPQVESLHFVYRSPEIPFLRLYLAAPLEVRWLLLLQTRGLAFTPWGTGTAFLERAMREMGQSEGPMWERKELSPEVVRAVIEVSRASAAHLFSVEALGSLLVEPARWSLSLDREARCLTVHYSPSPAALRKVREVLGTFNPLRGIPTFALSQSDDWRIEVRGSLRDVDPPLPILSSSPGGHKAP